MFRSFVTAVMRGSVRQATLSNRTGRSQSAVTRHAPSVRSAHEVVRRFSSSAVGVDTSGILGMDDTATSPQGVVQRTINSKLAEANDAETIWNALVTAEEESHWKSNYLTYMSAIEKCVSLDDMEAAERLFARAVSRFKRADTGMYNVLLRGHARRGDAAEASRIQQSMHSAGELLDSESYSLLAHAKARAGEGSEALRVLDQMRRSGLQPTVQTWNGLLLGYAACSDDGGTRSTDVM
jgi:pentatricopeptide repeat protein